jgi:hypothetical protein
MFESTAPAARSLALLLALACGSSAAMAQSAGIKRLPLSRLAASSLPAEAAADVTYQKGITIGQTFAPWGAAVTVPETQAYGIERGKCGFRIRYDMVNQGSAATPLLFKNTLAADASVVSTEDSLSLNPLQAKEVPTLAWLSPGTYNLILRLDAGNAVPELNENNNVVRVVLTLNGCQARLGTTIPKVPGDEKAHAPFLPPGTPNTADQTNEKPVPQVLPGRAGYGGPDTKVGQPALIDVDGSGIIQSGRRALVQQMGPLGYTIIVQFDGGVMTLSGKVPSLQAKADAEQAVRAVPGVTDVQNRLILGSPAR